MNKSILANLLILFSLLACDKEPEPRLSNFDTPLLTGFELRDDNGSHIGSIGTPNIKLTGNSCADGLKDIGPNSYGPEIILRTYPNPVNNAIAVNLFNIPISNIWIVQGQVNNDIQNTYQFGNSIISLGGAPLFSISGFTKSILVISTENLPSGYYRIYIEACNDVLYDNFIVQH